MPLEFRTAQIKRDMAMFEKHLESEIKKIEELTHPHSVKSLIKKQKQIEKLALFFKKYFGKNKSPVAKRKFLEMLSIITSMGKQLQSARKNNENLAQKMKAHQQAMDVMLKLHKTIVIGASEAHGKVIRKLARELKKKGKKLQ